MKKASPEIISATVLALRGILRDGELPLLRKTMIDMLLEQGHSQKGAEEQAELRLQSWLTTMNTEVN